MFREARQRVNFRTGARIGVIATSLAAAAALVLPTTALASTTIGSAQGNQPCTATFDTVQVSSVGPSYAVPTGGTAITDWFYQAATTDTGSVSLLVWRATATGGFTLIAVSPAVNLSDPTSTFALPAPIPVQAGDLIGLRLTGSLTCFYATANFGDEVGYSPLTALVGDTVLMSPAYDLQLNVRAAVDVASNPVATSADQCKKGGWQSLTDSQGTAFKNQGDCVSFVATDGTNTAAGS